MQAGKLRSSGDADARATTEAGDSFPAVGTEEWGLMNRRRSELIHKKNRQGLTAEEQAEFERLQHLCLSAIREKFPPPPVDDDGLKRLRESL